MTTETKTPTSALPNLLWGMIEPIKVVVTFDFPPAFLAPAWAGKRHSSVKKPSLIAGTKKKNSHQGTPAQ